MTAEKTAWETFGLATDQIDGRWRFLTDCLSPAGAKALADRLNRENPGYEAEQRLSDVFVRRL